MTVYISPDDPTLDTVGFDATMGEDHVFESTPTDAPVEDGSVITDHVIDVPVAFAATVCITNTPIQSTFEGEGDVLPTQLPVLAPGKSQTLIVGPSWPSPPSVQSFQIPGMPDRIKRTLTLLQKLRDTKALCTVFTSRYEYDSMVLVRIDTHTEKVGFAEFKLNFRHLTIVTNQTTKAPKPREPRAMPQVDGGSQTGILDQLKNLLPNFPPGQSVAYTLLHP
jgi:hypothetical protein